MARHIRYEMDICLYAASLVPTWTAKSDNRIGLLIFEAFLIHFRNLLQFFYGTNDKKAHDKARAVKYGFVAHRPDWYQEYSNRCNKLLAHPSYDRISYVESGRTEWRFEGQLEHLRAEWSGFLESLEPERRVWFDGASPLSEFKTESFITGTTLVTTLRPTVFFSPKPRTTRHVDQNGVRITKSMPWSSTSLVNTSQPQSTHSIFAGYSAYLPNCSRFSRLQLCLSEEVMRHSLVAYIQKCAIKQRHIPLYAKSPLYRLLAPLPTACEGKAKRTRYRA